VLERIVESAKIVLSSSLVSLLALNGCGTYVPMDIRTSRRAEVLPERIKNKFLSTSYDCLERELINGSRNYDEYKNVLKESMY